MTIRRIDRLCQLLNQQLLDGDLKPGDKLPSERQLALRYDTSRPLVREALQQLKGLGIIESRQGGGTYVCQSYAEPAGSPLSSLLSQSQDPVRLNAELLEYRITIEARCAALAAERATADDLQRLDLAYQHLRRAHQQWDLELEAQADARFHLAIAAASHNRVFLQTLQGLFGLLKSNVITNIGGLSSHPDIRARLMGQHARLFEAIYQRKPQAARAAAEEHLDYVREFSDRLSRERRRMKGNA